MTNSLFRKEVLEHRKDRLYGEVILLQPMSITLLVGVVVAVTLMILAILLWGTHARKETVPGYLLPDKGIVKSYSSQPGTIYKVHAQEGDVVEEGQTLVTLTSERSLQGGSDIDTLMMKEIQGSQTHQQERIEGERALLLSEQSRLTTQIEGLIKELVQVEHTLKAQTDRVQILDSRLAGYKKLLDNKNISEHDYQKLLEECLVQKQQYQELVRTKMNRQNNLMQLRSELEQLPIKFKSRINEIENQISELKQRQAEVQGRRSIEIRAPVSGTLTAIQAREGQMYANNMPLLAIIPKDSLFQAELFIPSRAIGFITPGQVVRLRYHAFPYQRFGIYEGTVSTISKHVLMPSELSVPVVELKEPVYRVTVSLKKQGVTAYGKEFPLQAGMSVDADIILDKQTLFQWILDPLISLKGRF